ncbi:MAG: AAA family ATPase [Parasutterella sp.]
MKSRGGLKHYGVKMLLELRLENFKNFKEFTVFSMVPQPEIRNLKYSVLKRKISGTREPQKALCSSVIFGPNASGKSNLIIAVEILKRIVLRGNILDDESVNFSASSLSLAPNSFLGKNTPVYIGISFITGELKIDYDLILALGGFLGNSIDRCVIGEKLSVNEKPVFDRKERHIELYNHPIMKEKFKVKGYKDLIIQLINEGLQPTDVFLSQWI